LIKFWAYFSRACIHFLSAASLTRIRVRNKRLVHPLSQSSRCRRCPRRRTRLSRLPVDLLLSSYSQLASLQQCSVIRICYVYTYIHTYIHTYITYVSYMVQFSATVSSSQLFNCPFCVTRSNPTHQLTDPTQPNPLQVEKFGPNLTQPNATNNVAYSSVVDYFIHITYRTFSQPSINLFMLFTDHYTY